MRILFILLFPVLCYAQNYEFSFVAWGDPQWDVTDYTSDSTETENIIALINAGSGGKQASFTLVLGDIIAENPEPGRETAFTETKAVLDKLDSTYYVIPGNHCLSLSNGDSLEYFQSTFTYPPSGCTGSVNGGYYFTKDSWVVQHFNTSIETDDLRYPPADTLGKYLALNQDKYMIVISHHPLSWKLDQLADKQLTDSVLTRIEDSLFVHDNVKLCYAGHVQTMVGEITGGIDFRVANSGNVVEGYEFWWVDVYDDGTFQHTLFKEISAP